MSQFIAEGEDTFEELKPYYVYEIRDPSAPPDQAVFYVGKGTGRRIEQHEREADRAAQNSGVTEQKRHQKILEIKARGETPIARVIGRFDTPEEAFAVEATLLHWVYGFPDLYERSALTNIQAGHNHRYIRPKGNFSELPNLDVRRRVDSRVSDGTFTRNTVQANDRYGVEDRLADLRAFCIEMNPDWVHDLSNVEMSNPKDPCFYLRVGATARIQVLLRGTRTRVPILNVRTLDNRPESKDRFFSVASRLFEAGKAGTVKMPKTTSPYFKISGRESRLHLSQPVGVYDQLKYIWELITIHSE
jgi:hypothetical protein